MMMMRQCLIGSVLMKVQWAWVVMHRVKVGVRGSRGLIRLWESHLLHISMAIVEICICVIVCVTGKSSHICFDDGRRWSFFTRWDFKCSTGRRSNCHIWFVYVHILMLLLWMLLSCSAMFTVFLRRNVSQRLLKQEWTSSVWLVLWGGVVVWIRCLTGLLHLLILLVVLIFLN